ncbi:MAG: hypothetical protein FJW23_11365 [Acidimicrobiia bacterium]|nr:hypothetical protein [Acidimicrobiia bacterium]
MVAATDDLQRVGLKLFVADPARIDAREVVPVFHRWIQTRALDHLLIDVADYGHLDEGPRVVLVAHEGNFVLDNGDRRLGLAYYRKQPLERTLADRLLAIGRIVVQAGVRLEQEPALGGRLRFLGEELQVVANDRLTAPATQAVLGSMEAALAPLLGRMYPEGAYTVGRGTEPGERATLTVRATGSLPLATLAERLAPAERPPRQA